MKTRKGWKKMKDKGRAPYWTNKALGAIVFRSAVAHCYLVHREGSGVQSGEYTTEQTAMTAVERKGA